jgi:hypothetical protein
MLVEHGLQTIHLVEELLLGVGESPSIGEE